jgi:hypothetical protein
VLKLRSKGKGQSRGWKAVVSDGGDDARLDGLASLDDLEAVLVIGEKRGRFFETVQRAEEARNVLIGARLYDFPGRGESGQIIRFEPDVLLPPLYVGLGKDQPKAPRALDHCRAAEPFK